MPIIDNTCRPREGDRLKELVLYVAQQSQGDERFGATKLQKLLFFIDFQAWAEWGKSVSGHTYAKRPNGPAIRDYLPAQNQMIADCEAIIQELQYFGKTQKRLVPLREPDLTVFSPQEVALIDQSLKRMTGISATAASEWSHKFIGWQVANEGEDIPYKLMFVSERELRADEWAKGSVLAASCGL